MERRVRLEIGHEGRAQLRSALLEARAARRDRSPPGVGGGSVDARCALATRRFERIIDVGSDDVDLGRLLDRVATVAQLGSTSLAAVVTSLPSVTVEGDVAQAIASALREVLYAIERSVGEDGGARVYVAGDWDGIDLTLAIACQEAASVPVPTGAGLAALTRSERLTELAGGTLVRGVRDGMALFGLAFRWVPLTT